MSKNSFYNLLAKSFKYEPIRRLKRELRPLKWAIFGKEGIYRSIDLVKELESKAGRDTLVVFDVGAADGEYALSFAQSFPRANIYCFEPQLSSFLKLKNRLMGYEKRVNLFQSGFYSEEKEIILNHLDLDHPDGNSMLSPLEIEQAHGIKTIGNEVVTVKKLDDFVKEHNISHIDFLKIDVEGVEKEVLLGGLDALRNKVDNIYIEISPFTKGKNSGHYIEVLKLLNDAGFVLQYVYQNDNFFLSKLV